MTNLIIGYGVVGHNLKEELIKLNPDVCDKYKGIEAKEKYHDFGWICVDTPLNENGYLDYNEVINAIQENDCGIYIIKSTVPVGITRHISLTTSKHIVFSPEFYGGTQHCNNFSFDFTILGGDKKDCIAVQQVLQEVYDGRHVFRITDSNTAEMVKFAENSWLATKVTFFCEFFRACERVDVAYEDLRELLLLDPRINPSHTFVYRDHPYFDSHCLNKDVPNIANQLDIELLKKIIEINEKSKKTY